MRQIYKSQITKIDYSPNGNVVFLYIKPEILDWDFFFKSGQFVVINTKIGEHISRRSYSIATDMTHYYQTWELWFIIKYVPLWLMSTYLVKEAKIGDIIDIVWPVGKMICDPEEKLNYLLISSGSGLWPIRSIYTSLQNSSKFLKIYQIFGEKNFDELLNLEDFKITNSDNTNNIYKNNNITNIVTFSRQKIDWYREWYVQSYISDGLSDLWISDKLRVYICGKPAMVEECVEILLEKWVDKQYIYHEKY